MVILSFTLELSGTKLSPKTVLSQLSFEGLRVTFELEPELENESDKYSENELGAIHLTSIKTNFLANNSEEPWGLFAHFLNRNHSFLVDSGVNKINISILATYVDQCLFELFDDRAISLFAPYNVSILISVSPISETAMNDLLAENDLNMPTRT